MGDHSTGLATAAGVCAALLARERTGEGQVVSTSLLRQGAYTISFDLSVTLGWGLTLQIGRRDNMGNPAMNNYTAGDGRRFWLVGLEPDRHWAPLTRAVGRPDWLQDERYATAEDAATTQPSLVVELDEIFATKSLDEWAEIFDAEPELSGRPSSRPTTCWPIRSSWPPGGWWTFPTGPAPPRWSPLRSSHTPLGLRRP